MRYRWDKKYLYWGVTALLVILVALVGITLIFRIDAIASVIAFVFDALMPVFWGIIIAFLIDPIVRFTERCFARARKKKWESLASNPVKQKKMKKRWRVYSILISLAAVFAALAGLFWLVIPQLILSIGKLVENFQGYYDNFSSWINEMAQGDSFLSGIAGWISSYLGKDGLGGLVEVLKSTVLPQWQNLLSMATTSVMSIIGVFMDLLIGFIIAIYFLYHKEKFIANIKMTLYSLLKKNHANSLIQIGQDVNKYFGGFLTGKILDSAIIGVICFIVMSIFQFDYALLISVIVGVTNIIPFFGPFIGAIPSALFLLIIDPMQAIYFVIWVLILQQIDGNIIGPLVLGNRTGVSGFWIITSITVFGGMWGLLGIIIAVPLCACLLVWTRRRVQIGLTRRKMDFDTSVYLHPGPIYESDDQEIHDDSYEVPVKVADLHRAPEVGEAAQQGTITKLIRRIKQRRGEKKKDPKK